jgi:hypothetical protein
METIAEISDEQILRVLIKKRHQLHYEAISIAKEIANLNLSMRSIKREKPLTQSKILLIKA